MFACHAEDEGGQVGIADLEAILQQLPDREVAAAARSGCY